MCSALPYVSIDRIYQNEQNILKYFDKNTKGMLRKLKEQYHLTGFSYAGKGNNYDKKGSWHNFKFKAGYDYKIDYTDGVKDFVWVFNKE